MKRPIILIGLGAVAAVAALSFYQRGALPAAGKEAAGSTIVAIEVPPLEGDALIGKRAFENACASCHGKNAVGQNGVAPPLVHKIYEPGHHGDASFQAAVAYGVRSHHWRFGDMPPVDGLTEGDVAMIVAYIRTLQRANGIE